MAINLQKGQRENISAQKFTIGLGWDTNAASNSSPYDLDASVFLLGDNGKLVADEFFIFYNNPSSPDGAVNHAGDNRTGDGDGDDEQIHVDLSKADARVKEICIVVTIHDAAEILKYDLDEDFSIETAVEFGRIYNRGGAWKFEAVGMGMNAGLDAFLTKYQ
jgi:tellurium resistance protein TerD